VKAEPYVRLVEISKRRGDRLIISNLNLDIMHGEFIALLGRSGSGKTTILRIVAGLETVDEGEIWLNGSLAAKDGRNIIPPRSRSVGFVFQDLALWPHLTVADSLDFVLASTAVRLEDRRKRISDLLSLARIPELGNRYPHQLSGGEQQRAALARALAPKPRLLLLDEPMSSLDAELKSELARELATMHRELGLTTVYVTHDVVEISALADRVIRLD
jgi:putative spermidine/putrescine transport system ATP-binding protein